ncbi:Arylsulfatase A [Algoriphagus boritolerans DSM 17298 = JCM 18970]|uniref:Arylsulfatase A n=2 Tax=Algoriphagus TaxID=246875 RepID=A0A1H6A4F0_9BACT|nr:Arylsulfatase A [Algoriphagus boritolerans DSM 17298 = JCM 18970]
MKKRNLFCSLNSSFELNQKGFQIYNIILFSALVFMLLSCSTVVEEKKPNIIYILVDQWRASATGYAGDPNVNTPNLDLLAKESFNFLNAVSVIPICTPYRASLMTGRFPTSTGMFLNDLHLPPTELCIGDALVSGGYQTGYIGKWHLDGHGRHSFIPKERRRGFQYWKVAECDHNYNNSHYYSGDSDEKLYWDGYDVFAQTKDAQQYIRDHADADKPFALFLSYGTPHFPHPTAPEEYKERYPLDKIILPANVPDSTINETLLLEAQGYYAHCEALDKSIGDLLATLDEMGLAENTLLVFTSDHGEMLGSHGVRAKAKQVPLSESAMVPFLLRYPAIHGVKGTEITMPINTPDIFPTLFGLAGLPIPATVEGEDLSSVIIDGKERENRAVLYMNLAPFVKGEYGREYRAVKTPKYSYVRSLEGPWLLFDDIKDPLQMDNLVLNPEFSDLVGSMDKKLQEKLREIDDDFRPAQSYVEEWGLVLEPGGTIFYSTEVDTEPQTPKRKSGNTK